VVVRYLRICYYNVQIPASRSVRVFFTSSPAKDLICMPCNIKILIEVYENQKEVHSELDSRPLFGLCDT